MEDSPEPEPNPSPLKTWFENKTGIVQQKLEQRLGRFGRLIWLGITLPVSFYKTITWEDDEAYGYNLIRHFWRTSWLGKIALPAILIFTSLGVYYLSIQSVGPETTEKLVVNWPILITGLACFAFGWAYGLTAVINLPLWVYFVASSYMIWYGIIIGGSLAGGLFFTLPSLWTLYLGWRAARVSLSKWRLLWLLLLCLECGHLTFAALSLTLIVPETWNLTGRLLLGMVYFALLTNRWVFKSLPPFLPSRFQVFSGSLAVMVIFFGIATWKDPILTSQNALLSMRGTLGLVDLFWLWLGWSLYEGALDLGEWSCSKLLKIFPGKLITWLVPAIWILVTIFGWVTTHPIPVKIAYLSKQAGLTGWVAGWDDPTFFAVQGIVYAGLVALLFLVGSLFFRRLSYEKLAQISGLWLASFIGLLGYYQCLGDFSSLESDASELLTFWTGLALLGGIIWELAKSGAYYWEDEFDARVLVMAGAMLLMVSISLVTLGAGLPDLVKEYTFYSFLGVVYLGVPVTLYTVLPEFIDYESPGGLRLLGLMGLGCVSAVVVLGINPYAGYTMLIAPILWILVLAVWGKRLARFEHPLDGLLGGGALGLGFVTFWMSPEILPVPFLVAPVEWQIRFASIDLNRPLLQVGQLWFTLLGVGVGMIIGLTFTWRNCRVIRGLVSVFAGLAFVFISPLIQGISTSLNHAIEPDGILPSPMQLPKPTEIPGWERYTVGETNWSVALPPGWIENPKPIEGILLNRLSQDGSGLFSVQVYDGFIDPIEAARTDLAVRQEITADFQEISEPGIKEWGALRIIYMETRSLTKRTHSLDAYMATPQGVLHLEMLSDPATVDRWRDVFIKIVGSLSEK